MIKYKIKKVEKKIPTAIECDICGITFKPHEFEYQEIVHIKHTCGYSSIFRDMASFELDICQNCMAKLIGKENIMRRLKDEKN